MTHIQDPIPPAMDRYLGVLGLARSPAEFPFLSRLVEAQLRRVPFENLSKLYRGRVLAQPGLPPLTEHLEGLERNHFGGTCYACNYYFHALLKSLGFDARFCGADMGPQPDVHTVVMVRLGAVEFQVDVGYGAPFFNPLPRDLTREQVIAYGADRYVLHPQDPQGRSRLDHLRHGKLHHGYLANPEPRPIEHFHTTILDSYSDTSLFMRTLRMTRQSPEQTVTIADDSLVLSTPDDFTVSKMTTRGEIVDAIVEYFEIDGQIATDSVATLGKIGDVGA